MTQIAEDFGSARNFVFEIPRRRKVYTGYGVSTETLVKPPVERLSGRLASIQKVIELATSPPRTEGVDLTLSDSGVYVFAEDPESEWGAVGFTEAAIRHNALGAQTTLDLLKVVVAKEETGRGIATLMVRKLLDVVPVPEHTPVEASFSAHNKGAADFYGHLGLKIKRIKPVEGEFGYEMSGKTTGELKEYLDERYTWINHNIRDSRPLPDESD